jgi:hypothetical protein
VAARVYHLSKSMRKPAGRPPGCFFHLSASISALSDGRMVRGGKGRGTYPAKGIKSLCMCVCVMKLSSLLCWECSLYLSHSAIRRLLFVQQAGRQAAPQGLAACVRLLRSTVKLFSCMGFVHRINIIESVNEGPPQLFRARISLMSIHPNAILFHFGRELLERGGRT